MDGKISPWSITIGLPTGDSYQVLDQDGSTDITSFASTSVPEPSSIVLAEPAIVGRRGRRNRPRR